VAVTKPHDVNLAHVSGVSLKRKRIMVFSWLLMSSGWLCASTFLPCRCFDCILSLGLWTSVVKIWKIRWSKLYKFMYSRRFQANMLFPVFLIVSSRSWFILPTISSDRRHRNSVSGNNHAQSRRVYHEHNCQKLSTLKTCKYCKYDGYREHTLTYPKLQRVDYVLDNPYSPKVAHLLFILCCA
jgi:hypothetical protein